MNTFAVTIEPEIRIDQAGEYRYVEIAVWETVARRQANQGYISPRFSNVQIPCDAANSFKVRYNPIGTRIRIELINGAPHYLRTRGLPPVPVDEVDRVPVEQQLWDYEQFSRDMDRELNACFERWLARLDRLITRDGRRDRRGTTLNLQVAAGADDGRSVGGSFLATGTSIDIGNTSFGIDKAFFRFTGVTIAGGATINTAALTVVAHLNRSATTVNTNIYCVDEDNAAAPTTNVELQADPLTTAFAAWDSIAAWTADEVITSAPDIASPVQEITDRAGWSSGNALMVRIDDDGSTAQAHRLIRAYDSSSADAAKLDIDYTAGGAGGPPLGSLALMGVGR